MAFHDAAIGIIESLLDDDGSSSLARAIGGESNCGADAAATTKGVKESFWICSSAARLVVGVENALVLVDRKQVRAMQHARIGLVR